MKKTKILSVILAAVMCSAMLAACDGSSDDEGGADSDKGSITESSGGSEDIEPGESGDNNDNNEEDESGDDNKNENDENDAPSDGYDPFAHIKITEKGYSGIGTISVESDDSDRIQFVCNVAEGLKNGDVVVISVDTDDMDGLSEYVRQTYGAEISRTSMDYTVSKLTEPETFDPFDGLLVIYDGISDRGTVTLNSVKTKMPHLQFAASETTGLSNGQTITVSIIGEQSKAEVDLACLEKGLAPSAYEKEFTVEGLQWFAQSLDEIPVDKLTSLMKDAGVKLRDRDYERFYGGEGGISHANFRIDSLNLISAYFMTTTTDEQVANQLVLIYEENVYYDRYNTGKTRQYYNYAIFSNVVLSSDKSDILLDLGEYSFCGNLYDYPDGSPYIRMYGYATSDQIYQQYVKAMDYKYIIEELDLSAYGVG